MDEWFGILFVIGCFALSFAMELKKKKKAMDEELSEPAEHDFGVIELEQAQNYAPKKGNTTQRNNIKSNTPIQATSKSNKENDEAAEDASLEEIRNAVIWSEILNRKYT